MFKAGESYRAFDAVRLGFDDETSHTFLEEQVA